MIKRNEIETYYSEQCVPFFYPSIFRTITTNDSDQFSKNNELCTVNECIKAFCEVLFIFVVRLESFRFKRVYHTYAENLGTICKV